MKSIMSALVVLVMVFALVSVGNAGSAFSTYNNDKVVSNDIGPMCWAGFCPAQNNDLNRAGREADRPNTTSREGYRGQTAPEPMGSYGY